METTTLNNSDGPAWASWLGVVAVLLGVLLACWHANEWMKLSIVGDPPFSVADMPEPACDEDEMEEEGLTLAECRQLALSVHDISISAPDWFRGFHMMVSFAGFVIALISILVGIALVDYRRWAPSAAFLTFGALAVVDIASFMGVVNTGPLIRQMYLWSTLLWFFIHIVMTVAAFTGREMERDGMPATGNGHG
ncbi:MAG: hypothetical protein WD750_04955 [Gammaproteobacteria bacterium]